MNPLARSRLEAAKSRLGMMHLNWQHADVDNETILAALDALLNPDSASWSMKSAGMEAAKLHMRTDHMGRVTGSKTSPDTDECADIYKAMITELTRDV